MWMPACNVPTVPTQWISKLDLEKSLEDFRATLERIAQQHGNPETFRNRMVGGGV
jgi:hypothetical protein